MLEERFGPGHRRETVVQLGLGDVVDQFPPALSGGERGRLALAVAMSRRSNLLVLDEPTNDLDLETLDLLEEMVSAYEGTVLLVSHDRDFLDRAVSSVIAPDPVAAAKGEIGVWAEYAGGYADMRRQQDAALARLPQKSSEAAPAKPKVSSKTKPTEKKAAKAKLSYKDQRDLELLPGARDSGLAPVGGDGHDLRR